MTAKKAPNCRPGSRFCMEYREATGKVRSTRQMHRAHTMSRANSFQWGL